MAKIPSEVVTMWTQRSQRNSAWWALNSYFQNHQPEVPKPEPPAELPLDDELEEREPNDELEELERRDEREPNEELDPNEEELPPNEIPELDSRRRLAA